MRVTSESMGNCSYGYGRAVQNKTRNERRRPIHCVAWRALMTFTSRTEWRGEWKESKRRRRSQILFRYS